MEICSEVNYYVTPQYSN